MERRVCLTPGMCRYLASRTHANFDFGDDGSVNLHWTCTYCTKTDVECPARGKVLPCETCERRFRCWTV